MKDNLEFDRGYVIACCNLVNLHDQPVMAFDLLRELSPRRADIKAMDLSEYDMAALLEIEKSRGSETFYSGSKK